MRRCIAFHLVGALGLLVQLAVLLVLTRWVSLNYLLGTALAVEAAVLHNFLWHERWTWANHTGHDLKGACRRLVLFHLANGALSIAGNLILMRFFVGTLAMRHVAANALAVAVCSIPNFVASDRLVFQPGEK